MRTLLSLEVGARVKLAPAHDHNLVPGFSLLNQNLSRAQRDKLTSPGPKYGSVTRVCPEKCAYEVTNIFGNGQYFWISIELDRFGCAACRCWWALGGWMLQLKARKWMNNDFPFIN